MRLILWIVLLGLPLALSSTALVAMLNDFEEPEMAASCAPDATCDSHTPSNQLNVLGVEIPDNPIAIWSVFSVALLGFATRVVVIPIIKAVK